MRRIILSFAVVLALVSAAAGQIQIDAEYAPHRPIVATLELPADPEGTQTIARWSVDAERIILDEGRVVHIWAPPGPYSLRCEVFTIDWEARKFTIDEYSAEFKVTGLPPDPDPPRPDPPDPPVPVTQPIWVTILEESADRTLEQARIYTSETFNDYFDRNRNGELDEGEHGFRTVDDDVVDENGDTPVKIRPLLSHAKSLPWMVIQAADGKILWDGPPPVDEESTLKLLKKYGGP